MTNNSTCPEITLRREGDVFNYSVSIPPHATEADKRSAAHALRSAADEIDEGDEIDEDELDTDFRKDDIRNAACCSAMRMIKLITLRAPLSILQAEIRSLTRLVEQAVQSEP